MMRRKIVLNAEQAARMRDMIAKDLAANEEFRKAAHGTSINALADGLGRLSAQIHATSRAFNVIRKEILSQRRKDDYALKKKYGLIKKRPTKAEKEVAAKEARKREAEYEDKYSRQMMSSCHCHLGHPPCSYCTLEIDDEEDDALEGK